MKSREIEDELFFQSREKIKNDKFSLGDLDQYPLFVGVHNMARNHFIINQFLETLNIPGNILEFGLWRGGTTVMLAKFLQLLRPQQNKFIIGFDNFSGLPEPLACDGNEAKSFVGQYKGDKDFLSSVLTLSNLDSIVRLVDGDAKNTIPDFFKDHSHDFVSFALLDFDLYEPTILAIQNLIERVSIGGKVLFDEGTSAIWKGEKKAMFEFVEMTQKIGQSWSCLENPITRQPTTVYTRMS